MNEQNSIVSTNRSQLHDMYCFFLQETKDAEC